MPKSSNAGHIDRAPDQEFPIAITTVPASAAQRKAAIGVIVGLMLVAALVAPFANRQLGRVDAFIPVLQTVLAVADFTTAVLLLAHCFMVPQQRAVLAVACAYLFSAAFAFLQTLAFPGAYAPEGLIGDGYNSPAWFFVLWHLTFSSGILAYALLKDRSKPAMVAGRSAEAPIGFTVLCVLIAVAGLAWLVTARVDNLPHFYTASITQQTRLGNQVNVGLLLWYGIVLMVLLARRRTFLDIWLIVIVAAWMPNFLVAALASSVRFTLGWYAARGFGLIASCMLLCVLLTEMTVLYSRLANAFSLLSRERANRLMSVDAATAAIAHEIRTPLGAIALNANTALAQVRAKPPVFEALDDILVDIEADSVRAGEVISVVRALFGGATDKRVMTRVEDLVRQALSLAEPDLLGRDVSVTTQFQEAVPHVYVDPAQLQQVLLNLIRNAIDAMDLIAPEQRHLRFATKLGDRSNVLISIRDTGAGIPEEAQHRVFDSFFTTKPSGMGLGLAISRTIVESHDGSLQLVESGPHGSTFEISLLIGSAIKS